MTTPTTVLKGLWDKLSTEQSHFLKRGQKASKLTLPFLLPERDISQGDLPDPYQSIGARGVNNLASKLLLTLFPPNAAFFRLVADSDIDLSEDENFTLSQIEQAALNELETTGFRPVAFEALQHLIVSGNALFHWAEGEPPRVFHLDQFVIQRDGNGLSQLILTKESVSKTDVPEGMTIVSESPTLYTLYKRLDKDTFRVVQELEGIPFNEGTIKEDRLPVVPLRLLHVSGESYGRGQVEQYLGDLISLEALMQSLVTGSAAASRLLFLVDKSSGLNVQKLAQTPNGGFVSGRPEDIQALQVGKAQDFATAQQMIAEISRRISFGFLLNTAVQRQGERVTAEEIRFMAQELEDALGGVYSSLSQEFQLPIVRRLLGRMTDTGKLPKLPDEVQPKIVTGIEALGRGQDLLRLRGFLADATNTLGPEITAQYLNPTEYLTRLAADYGVDPGGIIRSAEEVAQAAQQASVQALAESPAGAAVVNQVGALAANG